MTIIISIAIAFVLAFVLMEFVAWFAHKYLMHGVLWFLHRDHHRQPKGFFQRNDYFFLIFAIPSWLSIMYGALYQIHWLTAFGFGIAAFGLFYFLFHEVLIHRRFMPIRKLLFSQVESKYLKSVVKAHLAHHKHLDKNDGEAFGLLYVEKQYRVK